MSVKVSDAPLSKRVEIALAVLSHPDCPKVDSSRTLYGFQSADPLESVWRALFPEWFK